ncbi:hypothetical protein Tco_0286869 [Tanacetum coccineum]
MSQQNTHPFGDEQNAVRIIPGPAGILQLAQLRKTSEIREGGHNGEMLTQEYVRKITEEASEDDHFTRGPWLSAVQYLAAEGSIATRCFGELETFIKNGNFKVFHKDTSAVNSGSGASTSRESYWAVEI